MQKENGKFQQNMLLLQKTKQNMLSVFFLLSTHSGKQECVRFCALSKWTVHARRNGGQQRPPCTYWSGI